MNIAIYGYCLLGVIYLGWNFYAEFKQPKKRQFIYEHLKDVPTIFITIAGLLFFTCMCIVWPLFAWFDIVDLVKSKYNE